MSPVTKLTVTVPMATQNPLNDGHRHFGTVSSRRKKERLHVWAHLRAASLDPPRLPCVVTLTRVTSGRPDLHDGLPASLKSVVDSIAEYLGVDDGDTDKVTWRYRQAKGPPKQQAVVIEIESLCDERGDR